MNDIVDNADVNTIIERLLEGTHTDQQRQNIF